MGLTYFRRYRMTLDLSCHLPQIPPVPAGYEFLPFERRLLSAHGQAKFASFENEMDTFVFDCLSSLDGCTALMREITSRGEFIAEATWLCRTTDTGPHRGRPVGTIQGMRIGEAGSIQNLGIAPEHRGRRLGLSLLCRAAEGFRRQGLKTMQLEVTAENRAAVDLYHRVGFEIDQITYKASEL